MAKKHKGYLLDDATLQAIEDLLPLHKSRTDVIISAISPYRGIKDHELKALQYTKKELQ
ncbi:MAG: hypothetical protein WCI04_03290 [archaeon]